MSVAVVEWVLVVRFGLTAHRAIYGRLSDSTLYSKDYIQLSRKKKFIDDLIAAFPGLQGNENSTPITYFWPTGHAEGTIQKRSADRPHLAWITNNPPPPWRMSNNPSPTSVETIRGNPTHKDEHLAEMEFEQLRSSEYGQPFLIAVKLTNELSILHLRVFIGDPETKFEWANLSNTPDEIRNLADSTSENSALAWKLFSDEDSSTLYFDSSSKTNPWGYLPARRSENDQDNETQRALDAPVSSQASIFDSDSTAEILDHSETEVTELENKFEEGDYSVPDSKATVKTRGSAQRVFSKNVKDNYDWRCAATGIRKREFLIASHIVPWSSDESIRLDPANGICLSILVDRAFEHGYIIIQDDLTITVAWMLVGDDQKLAKQLAKLDGIKLDAPKAHSPKVEFLRRRRALQTPTLRE